MGWALSLRPRWLAAAKRKFAHPRARPRRASIRNVDLWPVYEVPQPGGVSPYAGNSDQLVNEMVTVLTANPHESTTDALAFLRRLYPKQPLALRLAALGVYLRDRRASDAERSRAALQRLYRELGS